MAAWLSGCRAADREALTPARRAAIADTLKRMVADAYDLSKADSGDAVGRLMSLYTTSDTVISAAGGRVTATRAGLERGLRAFYDNVGKNMRDPRWTWGGAYVDVLSADAAVLTATYTIPHLTPDGRPHVVGGVWTAVFARRGGKWVIVQEHLSDAPQQ